MANLDSILKNRDITLPTKVRLVKAMVFPVVMYECESWTIKKVEHRRTDAFEPWCWRKLSRVPWTARRSNQSILNEINYEYSLERLMLMPKLHSFGHLMWITFHWKRLWCWKDWRQKEKGPIKDGVVRQRHWINGHEFEQTPGDSGGQRRLASFGLWGCKESDMT